MSRGDDAPATSSISKIIVRQIVRTYEYIIYNIEFDLTVDEIYRGLAAIIRAFVRSDVAAESTARYQGAGLRRVRRVFRVRARSPRPSRGILAW